MSKGQIDNHFTVKIYIFVDIMLFVKLVLLILLKSLQIVKSTTIRVVSILAELYLPKDF